MLEYKLLMLINCVVYTFDKKYMEKQIEILSFIQKFLRIS